MTLHNLQCHLLKISRSDILFMFLFIVSFQNTMVDVHSFSPTYAIDPTNMIYNISYSAF